jgi:hypothetical protein
MRGSSALPGWADTICKIDRVNKNKNKIRLDWESRHAEEDIDNLVLNFDKAKCSFTEDSGLLQYLQQKIRELLANGSMPLSEIVDELSDEASQRSIEKAINDMEDIQVTIDPKDKRKRILSLIAGFDFKK